MNFPAVSDALGACPERYHPFSMLRERITTILVLLPILLGIFAAGGWLFAAAIVLVLGLAAAEYGMLFHHLDRRPSIPVLAGGAGLFSILRGLHGFTSSHWAIVLLILLAMIWHLIDYERGASGSGTDFAITISGALYVGWIGSYLISLRALPDGLWWLMTALPSIWLADSAAYFVGKRIGRHRLAPRLSPNKTWEGYLAGVIAGAVFGLLLAMLWRVGAGEGSSLSAPRGMLVGFVVSVLAPLGDLAVSMIKRESGAKDSGNLLPGHGGALDRVDTWIWSGVLGYYIASLF